MNIADIWVESISRIVVNNQERSSWFIRVIADSNPDDWTASVPNPGTYCPSYHGRIVLIRKPAISSFWQNHQQYMTSVEGVRPNTNWQSDSVSNNISATSILVNKDPDRRYKYIYLVFPHMIRLDNIGLSTTSNLEKNTHGLVVDTGVSIRAIAIYWRIVNAGSETFEDDATTTNIANLFGA